MGWLLGILLGLILCVLFDFFLMDRSTKNELYG